MAIGLLSAGSAVTGGVSGSDAELERSPGSISDLIGFSKRTPLLRNALAKLSKIATDFSVAYLPKLAG